MKKIILFVLAFGFLLTAWQIPVVKAADGDKDLSAYKWGYWDKMVAPAAMKLEIPLVRSVNPDPDPDPDPDPLPGPPIPNTPDKPGIPDPSTPPGGGLPGPGESPSGPPAADLGTPGSGSLPSPGSGS